MAGKSLMDRMQSVLGITRTELVAVIILAGGLLCGAIIKYVLAENRDIYYSNSESITALLDSLAEAEIPAYTGTNDTIAIEAVHNNTLDSSKIKYSENNLPKEKLDINTAPKEELMKLPGIGPKTADDIIAYRKDKPFGKASDIMEIKGIGEKKFEKLKSLIVVK